MSIEKAYMHADDAYIKLDHIVSRYRGMLEKEELEAVQLDIFRALQELAYMMDDGK